MKKRGFTLIELIIVLAIISISFLILTFRFSVIDRIGAENEIKAFVNDYYYARDKAISTGVEIELVFKNEGYTIGKEERKFKYVECLNVSERKKPDEFPKIEFQESGYVGADSTKEAYNLSFVSKKDPQKQWNFTIQAIGGYLNEKE